MRPDKLSFEWAARVVLAIFLISLSGCSHNRPWSQKKGTVTVGEKKSVDNARTKVLLARDKAKGAAKDSQEVEYPYRVTFDPVDPTNVTVIYFFVDTEGLDWWPTHCGPTDGYAVCPDALTMLDVEQQIVGLTSQGEHWITTHRDNLEPDHGELFIFSQDRDPKSFEGAKQALKDGVLQFTLRTFPEQMPVDIIFQLGSWPVP